MTATLLDYATRLLDGRESRDAAEHIVAGTSIPLHHACFWRWDGVRFVCRLVNEGGASSLRITDARKGTTA